MLPIRDSHPLPLAQVFLTVREREVASYLGEDDTYAEIAARLGIRTDTVRNHARAIQRKLGVGTRHAAVARLIRFGFPTTQKGGIDPAC
jgi:DNA-binding CsgD family transcriptional regulator